MDLIEACKQNDRKAQEELFEKYKNQVHKTALIFCRNHSLADDITQESFIRIFQKLHLYDDNYPFEAWLYRVVINCARNVIKKQRWEKFFQPYENEIVDNIVFSDDIEKHEERINLMKHLDELPLKHREVIVLKYFNGFSQDDISKILQIPVGTVKSRINTALEKLRKKLSVA